MRDQRELCYTVLLSHTLSAYIFILFAVQKGSQQNSMFYTNDFYQIALQYRSHQFIYLLLLCLLFCFS